MDEPPGQDKSAERLRNMSEVDFKELLENCVNRKTGSAYTEFIEEIQNNVSKVPEESQTGLTNTKCNSSSLQSLDARDKGDHSKQHTASGVYGHPIESQSSLITTNCSSAGSSMKAAAGTSYSYQNRAGRDSLSEDFKDKNASDYSRIKTNHFNLDNQVCTIPGVEYQRDSSDSKSGLHSPLPPSATSAFASRHLSLNAKHANRKQKFKKPESIQSEKLADNGLKSTKWTVDAALSFIGVEDNVKVEKRGPKRKDLAGKEKHGASDTLGKSLSLDDDNLRMIEKKSAGKDRYSSLKDFEEANSRSEEEAREIADLSMPNSSSLRKKSTERRRPVPNKSDIIDDKQVSDIQDCNFTVVTRKKKNKTASITSPTDNMKSIAGGRSDTRRNRTRSDRRKSVDSAHGSENSEGSDDGSVRSLPAGGCSRKETVQKSCASSGGTPQTSYADITRLAKDEEILLKDSPQTSEEYPSLHGSDNCDVSEDGSYLSGGSGIPQKPTNAATGGVVTSYAAIAKSIRQDDRKDDGKPNVVPHDFPELPVGPGGLVVQDITSPKSDPGYSANVNGNIESAFPDLSGDTMKHPAVFSVKGTNGNTRNRVVSESSVLSEAAMNASALQPTTTSLRNISGSYSAKCASTFFSGSPTPTEPSQFRSPFSESTASASPLLDVVKHIGSSGQVDEVQLFNVPQMVNGHGSLEFVDIDSTSDIDGAKSKNTVSKPHKSCHGISEDSAEDTKAVVFCGRNFKQQPILPDNDFFFGVDFKGNLAPSHDSAAPGNDSATGNHFAFTPAAQVQTNNEAYDRSGEIGVDSSDSRKFHNSNNQFRNETGYDRTKRGGHERQNGNDAKEYNKKGKQFVPVDPHLRPVSAMIPGVETGATMVAFPVTPGQPHPGTPLAPHLYGIPGYHPIPFQGHTGAMVQPLPGMLPMGVPFAQVPYDGKAGPFSPPIAFIPATIAHVSPMQPANTVQGGPVGHLDGRELGLDIPREQPSSELHEHEDLENNELHSVPEQNEELLQQYEPEEVVTYSPAVAIPTSSPNLFVITHPLNFAQFYLPPDVSLYSHANVDGLRSYLEKREEECLQLHSQAKVRYFV